MTSVTERVFNFSSGPAVLPVSVLEEVQRDLLCLPGAGASILEISHRSKAFLKILEETKAGLRHLLSVPDSYEILFLQGGSRLQFSMIPMNLLRDQTQPADYVLTGSWSKYAVVEAQKEGPTRVVWDGKATNYDRLPTAAECKNNPLAAYVHITSNETIQGVQFSGEPDTGGAPLVCDSSSDFLSRSVPIERYGMLYACAQKNAGPAGITVVIVRQDLLERSQASLPGYLSYQVHAKENSLFNTPNTFGIYMVGLVVRWLTEDIGGLTKMFEINRHKARLLYDVIDASNGFYQGHAHKDCRSLMNVTFRLPSPELEQSFFSLAQERGLDGLPGHRSVGGVRASIYNAMPLQGVQTLREFMLDFLAKHSK